MLLLHLASVCLLLSVSSGLLLLGIISGGLLLLGVVGGVSLLLGVSGSLLLLLVGSAGVVSGGVVARLRESRTDSQKEEAEGDPEGRRALAGVSEEEGEADIIVAVLVAMENISEARITTTIIMIFYLISGIYAKRT
ncbi:MAG: hypothetical protein H7A55_01990 [Verrucomicrobiaceae bacterium]|nr:hypothetical protein [Verrucomicrobiaceae bacterium]